MFQAQKRTAERLAVALPPPPCCPRSVQRGAARPPKIWRWDQAAAGVSWGGSQRELRRAWGDGAGRTPAAWEEAKQRPPEVRTTMSGKDISSFFTLIRIYFS